MIALLETHVEQREWSEPDFQDRSVKDEWGQVLGMQQIAVAIYIAAVSPSEGMKEGKEAGSIFLFESQNP